jgi:hypothetical protein
MDGRRGGSGVWSPAAAAASAAALSGAMAGAVRERWRLVRAPAALARKSKREDGGSGGGEDGFDEQDGRSMEMQRWCA